MNNPSHPLLLISAYHSQPAAQPRRHCKAFCAARCRCNQAWKLRLFSDLGGISSAQGVSTRLSLSTEVIRDLGTRWGKPSAQGIPSGVLNPHMERPVETARAQPADRACARWNAMEWGFPVFPYGPTMSPLSTSLSIAVRSDGKGTRKMSN